MVKKIIKPAIIVILVLLLIFSTFGVVQTGNVGVLSTLGMVSDNVKREGIYCKIPFIQSIEQMETRTKKIEWINTDEAIYALSKDMMDEYIQMVVTYHIIEDKAATIYKSLGMAYDQNIIAPLTVNAVKTCFGKHTVDEIIQSQEKITAEINDSLKKQLLQYNIVLEFVSIINVDLRPELKAAIEQSKIAEKQVETQKYTLEKQALEAQQQVKKAEADKKAKILAAEAEQEFNQKVSGSINDAILKYKALQSQEKAIEKWNGQYPQVVAGGQSIPIIQLPEQEQKSEQKEVSSEKVK